MTKELLDLILAQLAEDFPDTAKTYSAEVFADWLTGRFGKVGVLKCPSCGLADVSLHQCCHNSACTEYAEERTVYEGWKTKDLSPTGRHPSQPELQNLPRSYQLPAIKMTEERAKELLQQYRDTFPDISAPWLTPEHYPNFPCVAVDLASGVDYSVEQHPIKVDHASIDDKGNVSVSGTFSAKGPQPQNLPKWGTVMDGTRRGHYNKEALFAPYTATLKQVLQQQSERSTDIYKDLAKAMRTMTKEEARRECCRHVWQYLTHASSALDFCVMCYTTRGHIGGFKGMTAVETDEAVQRFRLTCVHQFEDDGVHTSPICFLCGAPKR